MILDYLYKDKMRHAYVIKALEEQSRDFELVKDENDQKNFAAVWHQDSIVSLSGDRVWCQRVFDYYYGRYDYFDMESDLLHNLINIHQENLKKTFDDTPSSSKHRQPDYAMETHFLMKLNLDFDIKGVTSKSVCNEIKPIIKRVSMVKNTSRYQLVEPNGRVLGTLLVERAAGDLHILSEILIHKQFRGRGLGLYFVKNLITKIQSATTETEEFILYVDEDNTPALNLYKTLGFEVIGTYKNLILNQD